MHLSSIILLLSAALCTASAPTPPHGAHTNAVTKRDPWKPLSSLTTLKDQNPATNSDSLDTNSDMGRGRFWARDEEEGNGPDANSEMSRGRFWTRDGDDEGPDANSEMSRGRFWTRESDEGPDANNEMSRGRFWVRTDGDDGPEANEEVAHGRAWKRGSHSHVHHVARSSGDDAEVVARPSPIQRDEGAAAAGDERVARPAPFVKRFGGEKGREDVARASPIEESGMMSWPAAWKVKRSADGQVKFANA